MKKLLLGLLLTSSVGHASTYNLQDFGNYTLDKNSGLEWLDTSFTLGKSYNEVLAMTAAGNALEGWRFASYNEFTSIFTSRGYTFAGSSKLTANVSIQNNDPFFNTLINFLGATDTSSAYKDVLGLTAEDYKGLHEDSQYYGFIRTSYNTTNITSYANFSRYQDNRSAPTLASFLVRSVSPVPTPNSWAMMLAGLMVVSIATKTRRA